MKDILKARENRGIYIRELIDKFNLPIVVITLNTPGYEKCKENYLYAHSVIVKDFVEELYKYELPIIYSESRLDKDGPEFFLVTDMDSKDLKKIGLEFEEKHLIGRIADIDVQDKGKLWSRRDLDLKERSCLICDNPARRCILSGKHSLEEVIIRVDKIISNYKITGESK